MLTRRQLLRSMLAAPAAFAAPAAKRPNIVYIMADDHAAHAISAYGSKIIQTPSIDKLAKQGMLLKNCFCTNSICVPSRGVLLTGQHSHMTGIKTLADSLDPARPNIGKMLRAGGYQTAMIGKWHLVKEPSGFDYWNILPGQGVYDNPVFIEMGKRSTRQGYCTDLIADYSIDWIKKRDKTKPFFLLCHHKAPHRPWDPDAKHKAKWETREIPEPDNLYDKWENRSNAAKNTKLRVGQDSTKRDMKTDIPPDLKGDALRKWAYQRYMRDYLACVESVDDNVGRVLDALDAEGIADNTVVIYTSDQGFFLGDHGYFDKRFMYEESLRMPFLVRYPPEIKAGSVTDAMCLNLDFAETFLDFAGEKIPADMQGRSLRPVFAGKTPKNWRKSMYYRYWMHLADHNVPAHYGVRTHRYKLIYYYGDPLGSSGSLPEKTAPEWEMFDLQKDPREMRSVYADPAYQKVVASLKKELYRLKAEAKDNA